MTTPLEDATRELVLLFRSLKGLHATVLGTVGVRLEMPAAAVLTRLDEGGRQRVSTLAEALHLDLSSVSRQVTALEREGWVRRERDPADSRAQLLELTDGGRDVLERVRASRLALLRERLPGWTDAELEQFAAQLRRFRADVTPETATPRDTSSRETSSRVPAMAGEETR